MPDHDASDDTSGEEYYSFSDEESMQCLLLLLHIMTIGLFDEFYTVSIFSSKQWAIGIPTVATVQSEETHNSSEGKMAESSEKGSFITLCMKVHEILYVQLCNHWYRNEVKI